MLGDIPTFIGNKNVINPRQAEENYKRITRTFFTVIHFKKQ